MGQKTFIVVGLLGCLTGVLVASIGDNTQQVTLPSASSPVPETALPESVEHDSEKVIPTQKPTNSLTDAVQAAHARLVDEENGGSSRLSPALKQAIRNQKTYQPILRDFFQQVGQGALVSGGKLTQAGRAVVEYTTRIEDHGLKSTNFPVAKVRALLSSLKPIQAESGDAKTSSARERIVQGLLLSPEFDAEKVSKVLARMSPPLSRQELDTAEKSLKTETLNQSPSKDEVDAEMATARLLMNLVLDFKIFRRAGPFRPLTNKSEAFALWNKRPKKTVRHMTDIALAEAPSEAITQLEPTRPEYKALVDIHRRYLTYAEAGCHKRLNPDWRLQQGRAGSEVRELQKRLACEGLYKGPIHGSFDDAVKSAVITYQKHHSLNDEGFVKKGTISSMNVPLKQRAAQIGLVLQRMRESAAETLGDAYIRVNVPAFEMDYIRNNKVIRSHDVIVGTNRLDDNKLKLIQGHLNRTRLFTTELYEVVVNPDWILPERVEKGEVRTKLGNDPNYLKKNNIRRITLPSGKSAMVQGRGELNVLGKVKFHLRESNAIFLHDTNDRSLFRHPKRDLSHGCIRVKHAERFAKWLLDQDGWDEADVRRTFKAEKTQRGMKLKKPIPLITEYMTVSVSVEGLPIFYRDVYGYDKAYFKGQLPATTEVRWGAANLRPSWVPRVPEEIVNGWRRAGKPAPRDYKPPQ